MKLQRLVILKLKKINFDDLIVLVFLEDLDIENVLVSNNISSGEKKL